MLWIKLKTQTLNRAQRLVEIGTQTQAAPPQGLGLLPTARTIPPLAYWPHNLETGIPQSKAQRYWLG